MPVYDAKNDKPATITTTPKKRKPTTPRDWEADFKKLVAYCVTIGIGANAIKRILAK